MAGVDVITQGESLRQYWGRATKQAVASKEILTLVAGITGAEFLVSSFHHPFCIYYLKGRRLEPAEAFSVETVDELLSLGVTAAMQKAHIYLSGFSLLKQFIDHELSTSCSVTGFYTPAGGEGLAWHRDQPHVCAVQLEGHKVWDIETEPPVNTWDVGPVSSDDEKSISPISISMNPGDLLYAPPGVAHRAMAGGDETSFHFSIIFPPDLSLSLLSDSFNHA
ncbi:MAG TPA: cupin domain-containing protein [Kineosporiaceae bacterium]